jgi:pSer/pThr/pTyr-binding forkhead associated (FHA) protein
MEVLEGRQYPIVVHQPGGHVQVFHERFTAGRDVGAGLFLDDPLVSLWHASFTPGMGGWTVSDLGSFNGTWVDGVSAQHPYRLAKGSKVRIGRAILTVVPVEHPPETWNAILLPL